MLTKESAKKLAEEAAASNGGGGSDAPVSLRKSSSSASAAASPAKKQCRVLFSYTPTHDDELELKVDEVIDYLGEVEDGWWRGQVGTHVGVFPSNFVEMIAAASSGGGGGRPPLASENKAAVESKNKKNDNLNGMPTGLLLF